MKGEKIPTAKILTLVFLTCSTFLFSANAQNSTNNVLENEAPEKRPTIQKLLKKRDNRVKVFVRIGVGIMIFSQKMLVADSTNFNFTGDFGGGLYITTDPERQKRVVIVGYRYFHISNFYLSKVNPATTPTYFL